MLSEKRIEELKKKYPSISVKGAQDFEAKEDALITRIETPNITDHQKKDLLEQELLLITLAHKKGCFLDDNGTPYSDRDVTEWVRLISHDIDELAKSPMRPADFIINQDAFEKHLEASRSSSPKNPQETKAPSPLTKRITKAAKKATGALRRSSMHADSQEESEKSNPKKKSTRTRKMARGDSLEEEILRTRSSSDASLQEDEVVPGLTELDQLIYEEGKKGFEQVSADGEAKERNQVPQVPDVQAQDDSKRARARKKVSQKVGSFRERVSSPDAEESRHSQLRRKASGAAHKAGEGFAHVVRTVSPHRGPQNHR